MGVTGTASGSGTLTIPSGAAAGNAAWVVCWTTTSATATGWSADVLFSPTFSYFATLLRKTLTSADPGSILSASAGLMSMVTLDEVDGSLAPNYLLSSLGAVSSITPAIPAQLDVPGWSQTFLYCPGDPSTTLTAPGALTQDYNTGTASSNHLAIAHEKVSAGAQATHAWTASASIQAFALVLLATRLRVLRAGFGSAVDSGPYDRADLGFQVRAKGGPGFLTAGARTTAASIPNDNPGPGAPALPSSWSPVGAPVIQRVSEVYPEPTFVDGQLVGDWEPA